MPEEDPEIRICRASDLKVGEIAKVRTHFADATTRNTLYPVTTRGPVAGLLIVRIKGDGDQVCFKVLTDSPLYKKDEIIIFPKPREIKVTVLKIPEDTFELYLPISSLEGSLFRIRVCLSAYYFTDGPFLPRQNVNLEGVVVRRNTKKCRGRDGFFCS